MAEAFRDSAAFLLIILTNPFFMGLLFSERRQNNISRKFSYTNVFFFFKLVPE